VFKSLQHQVCIMADYELSLDLTDADAQIYSSNIASLLHRLIPSFDAKHSDRFFTKIQLRCHLNVTRLGADSDTMHSLRASNGQKPRHLRGGMVAFHEIKKPVLSMQSIMSQRHRPHRGPSNPKRRSPPSSPGGSASDVQHKKRVVMAPYLVPGRHELDSDRLDECKQPLLSSLPAPVTPVFGPSPMVTVPIGNGSDPMPTPPPSYEVASEWIAMDHLDGNDHGHVVEEEVVERKWAEPMPPEYAQHHDFGANDRGWNLEENGLNDVVNANVDDDYALALRLDQELKEEDEDRRMAQRLQEEEDLMAERGRRRRPRYRNENFVDFGALPGDELVVSPRRPLDARSWRQWDDAPFGPEPNESAEEGMRRRVPPQAVGARSVDGHRLGMRMLLRRQWDPEEEDLVAVHELMAGPPLQPQPDWSWQRLPTRTLTEHDVEIRKKSEEKRSCAICLNEFAVGDTTRSLPCFHEFHRECVDHWFQRQNAEHKDCSCPLDRKKIKDLRPPQAQ